QTYVAGADADALLAAPVPGLAVEPAPPAWANLPLLDFSRERVRADFAAALDGVRASLPRRHVLPDGAAVTAVHTARNPARPSQVLGEIELAGVHHAEACVAAACGAFPAWSGTPAAERCRILRRAAAAIVERRLELAALEVLEAAKPWREADADVAEAADFLRYYADEMERLAGWRTTVDFPGEANRFGYGARGIAVVVAPWNFPLAILAGMTAAALAAGNCVVMKPAVPALLVAHELLAILRQAGVPAGAVQLAPGEAELGAALVGHPDVQVIAFTGSRRVGLEILQAAHTPAPGQRHVKQVVCEMGGKNAIVVDADADLDETVAGILASAFGYSGQKCSACSRVIAVDAVPDRLLARLVAAAAALAWGPPEDPAWDHGPLITAAARDKALAYLDIGCAEGRLVWQGTVPAEGWYAPPAIFADIRPEHRLAREEVFGPVLAVLRAPDFAAALALAADSDYALTGGVYSRLPAHLALAQESFRVGNLDLNRRITGARVGVQPFGGVALSGTGVQAGGPDYLRQFLWSRSVAINTRRHGMLPAANQGGPGDV
ncbi:partial RHH-type transcriptional regulator, proline utilization regulon repressor / proline dehydrogenase / delta 1-pyrroline-5-carboxylate dehydrogenase, partial [Rhodocyclaceae bacterium]